MLLQNPHERNEQGGIKNRAPPQRPHPLAPATPPPNPQGPQHAKERKRELHDLKHRDELLPPWFPSGDGPGQEIRVHDDVHRAIGREAHVLRAHGRLQPPPGHEEDQCMVVYVQEEIGGGFAPRELEEGVEELIVLAEVVQVAPVAEREETTYFREHGSVKGTEYCLYAQLGMGTTGAH